MSKKIFKTLKEELKDFRIYCKELEDLLHVVSKKPIVILDSSTNQVNDELDSDTLAIIYYSNTIRKQYKSICKTVKFII